MIHFQTNILEILQEYLVVYFTVLQPPHIKDCFSNVSTLQGNIKMFPHCDTLLEMCVAIMGLVLVGK